MNLLKKIFNRSSEHSEQQNHYEGNAGEFRKLFRLNFVPFLRKNKWKGSGFRFYRVNDNQTIYFLEVYPDKYGKGFTIGLGVHLTFIPYRFAEDLKNYRISGLDIRDGISNPDNQFGLLISYPKNDIEVLDLFIKLTSEFNQKEKSFFNLFADWRNLFENISVDKIESENLPIDFHTKTRAALICSKVLFEIGEKEKAKKMAQYGMSKINKPSGNGSALIPEFEEIIKCS